jgi:hypothetical protein
MERQWKTNGKPMDINSIVVKRKKNLRKSLGDVSGLNWASRGMKKRN